MKKEVITFLLTLAVLAGLWFIGRTEGAAEGGRGRRGGGPAPADPQAPAVAKSTPGRFVAATDVTWAADGSNIFETPTETRDLPPLDLAPPPFPRLPHPGLPLPVAIALKARGGMRLVIQPSAAPAGAAPAPQNGGDAPGDQTGPGGGASDQPLVPLGGELSLVQKHMMTLEQQQQRALQEALARETEEDRKKRLDRITFTNGSTDYGEIVTVDKKDDRYAAKKELDRIRTDPGLTEPDRNEKLRKFTRIAFRSDRKGRLTKAQHYTGDAIEKLTFADTVENNYRLRVGDASPTDLAVQLELARMVAGAGLPKLAIQHLEAMKRNGLKSTDIHVMLADAHDELFQYNDEMAVLRQGLQEFPDSAPILGRIGRLFARLGMFEEAREHFTKALARNPADPLANAGLGALLMRSGDAGRAVQHLREALSTAGSDPVRVDGVRILLAEAYLRNGEFRNAHETVDLILQRTGTPAPAHARIFERANALSAMTALAQGQVVEARTRAEAGLKNHPMSGVLTYLVGIIQAQQGERDAARARLQLALELDPLLTGHAMIALAMLDEAGGADNAAVADAEAGALVANPAARELRLPLGRALLHVGDLARAREQLLNALDYEPRSADALVALGDVAYAEGILPDAIRFYDRAAQIEPGYPQLLPRRIIAQVRRRRVADAEGLKDSVGTADQKDAFVQAALAYFHYTKGNQAEAISTLQRLATEGGDGPLGAYAKAAHAALVAHNNRIMWTDTFSRTGTNVGRDWQREIGRGVNVALKDSTLTFAGTQRGESDKPTMFWQERPGDRFHSFSVDLDMKPRPGVYAGVGLMVMNPGARATPPWPGKPERDRGTTSPYTGLQVALNPDGKLVYRVLVRGSMSEWEPVPLTTYTGGPVTIEIRFADRREGVLEVLVNRESVLRQTLADLKAFRRAVELQVFCQAQIEREVQFTADNVVIVTLKEPR